MNGEKQLCFNPKWMMECRIPFHFKSNEAAVNLMKNANCMRCRIWAYLMSDLCRLDLIYTAWSLTSRSVIMDHISVSLPPVFCPVLSQFSVCLFLCILAGLFSSFVYLAAIFYFSHLCIFFTDYSLHACLLSSYFVQPLPEILPFHH